MRPILFDVDMNASPPEMTICLPGRPNRFATLSIRARVTSLAAAQRAAIGELDALTPDQLELIGEIARPAPSIPDAPPTAAMIRRVSQDERYAGMIYCPACCHPLGKGDNPAIGYLEACPSCQRGLTIIFAEGAVLITLTSQ